MEQAGKENRAPDPAPAEGQRSQFQDDFAADENCDTPSSGNYSALSSDSVWDGLGAPPNKLSPRERRRKTRVVVSGMSSDEETHPTMKKKNVKKKPARDARKSKNDPPEDPRMLRLINNTLEVWESEVWQTNPQKFGRYKVYFKGKIVPWSETLTRNNDPHHDKTGYSLGTYVLRQRLFLPFYQLASQAAAEFETPIPAGRVELYEEKLEKLYKQLVDTGEILDTCQDEIILYGFKIFLPVYSRLLRTAFQHVPKVDDPVPQILSFRGKTARCVNNIVKSGSIWSSKIKDRIDAIDATYDDIVYHIAEIRAKKLTTASFRKFAKSVMDGRKDSSKDVQERFKPDWFYDPEDQLTAENFILTHLGQSISNGYVPYQWFTAWAGYKKVLERLLKEPSSTARSCSEFARRYFQNLVWEYENGEIPDCFHKTSNTAIPYFSDTGELLGVARVVELPDDEAANKKFGPSGIVLSDNLTYDMKLKDFFTIRDWALHDDINRYDARAELLRELMNNGFMADVMRGYRGTARRRELIAYETDELTDDSDTLYRNEAAKSTRKKSEQVAEARVSQNPDARETTGNLRDLSTQRNPSNRRGRDQMVSNNEPTSEDSEEGDEIEIREVIEVDEVDIQRAISRLRRVGLRSSAPRNRDNDVHSRQNVRNITANFLSSLPFHIGFRDSLADPGFIARHMMFPGRAKDYFPRITRSRRHRTSEVLSRIWRRMRRS